MPTRSVPVLRWLILPLMLLADVACTSEIRQVASSPQPLAASFRAKGQADLDRLQQNDMQVACSAPDAAMPSPEIAAKIQAEALASVKYPVDGKLLGDWKAGEKIAQTGTGLQYSDDPAQPNGGNCYACHQLAPKEIAFGTLGPSLTQYGKLRGSSEPVLKLTWARLWNEHAYNVCTNMPRFGDAGILTERQLKDVMAYLFDPGSPVNQ